MADHHSTRACVHCGIPFTLKAGRGRKPFYCSDSCRRAGKTAGGTRHGTRIDKPCAWCGESMQLTPSQARKRETCSKSCANHLRAHRAGKQPRKRDVHCAGCHQHVVRTIRSGRDAGKYCSRKCAFDVLARVSKEREALRRISRRKHKKAAERYRTVVLTEIQALRRIARYEAKPKTFRIPCRSCGADLITRRNGGLHRIHCNSCKAESLKASRRITKHRRRARKLGREHDSIDPFKVFERDKWRCHLCGVRTPKRLRGTLDDRAPELEHIVSLAEGGTHTWGNVACSCRKCNQDKGAASRGQLGLAIA